MSELQIAAAAIGTFGSATAADVRVLREYPPAEVEAALAVAGVWPHSVDELLYGDHAFSVFGSKAETKGAQR